MIVEDDEMGAISSGMVVPIEQYIRKTIIDVLNGMNKDNMSIKNIQINMLKYRRIPLPYVPFITYREVLPVYDGFHSVQGFAKRTRIAPIAQLVVSENKRVKISSDVTFTCHIKSKSSFVMPHACFIGFNKAKKRCCPTEWTEFPHTGGKRFVPHDIIFMPTDFSLDEQLDEIPYAGKIPKKVAERLYPVDLEREKARLAKLFPEQRLKGYLHQSAAISWSAFEYNWKPHNYDRACYAHVGGFARYDKSLPDGKMMKVVMCGRMGRFYNRFKV